MALQRVTSVRFALQVTVLSQGLMVGVWEFGVQSQAGTHMMWSPSARPVWIFCYSLPTSLVLSFLRGRLFKGHLLGSTSRAL